MSAFRKFISIGLTAILVAGLLTPRAAFGLTVREEEKMARSFLPIIFKYFNMIEDPVIVNYVNKVGIELLRVWTSPCLTTDFTSLIRIHSTLLPFQPAIFLSIAGW